MPPAFDIARPTTGEHARRHVARNQAILRRVNEAIRGDDVLAFRCECGRLGCNVLLELTRDEYEELREHPRRFAVVEGHAMLEIETTVARNERYAVVEVHDPAAAAVAERMSPRGASEG